MRGNGVLVERPDWIRIPEAAYAPARDDAAWMENVIDGVKGALSHPIEVGMQLITHDADFAEPVNVVKAFPPAWGQLETDQVMMLRGEIARNTFYPPFTVGSHVDLFPLLDEENGARLRDWRRGVGLGDCLAMITHPAPNTVLLCFAFYANELTQLSPRDRRVLTQAALHIESGYRLRHRPEMVRAELTPDGQILDTIIPTDDVPANDVLEMHAAKIKRARSKQHRSTPEALELWTSLIEGRVTLTPRDRGSERRYVVLDNPISTHPLLALSKGERDVITLAARGLSTKLTAYALGISSATVSSRLGSIARKLGLASRTELVRIAAMLARDPRADLPEKELTAAEQDILDLLRLGLSNRDIATRRSRSVRTIANQVASLLRKTGSTSRRQLVARLQ